MSQLAPNTPNRQVRLHLAAGLCWLTVLGTLAFAGLLAAVYLKRGGVSLPMLTFGLAALLVAHVGYLLCTQRLKCVVCGQPVFNVSAPNRPHPHAKKFLGFSFRLQVSREILTGHQHHCIHCHSVCRTRRSIAGQDFGGAQPLGQHTTPPRVDGTGNPFFGHSSTGSTGPATVLDKHGDYDNLQPGKPSDHQAQSKPLLHPERPPWAHHGKIPLFQPTILHEPTNHEADTFMNPPATNQYQAPLPQNSSVASPFEALLNKEGQGETMPSALSSLFQNQGAPPPTQAQGMHAGAQNQPPPQGQPSYASPFRPTGGPSPTPPAGLPSLQPFSASTPAQSPFSPVNSAAAVPPNPFSVFGPPTAEPQPGPSMASMQARPAAAPPSPFAPGNFAPAQLPTAPQQQQQLQGSPFNPVAPQTPPSRPQPVAAPPSNPFANMSPFTPAVASNPQPQAPSPMPLPPASVAMPPQRPAPTALQPALSPSQAFPGFGAGFPQPQIPSTFTEKLPEPAAAPSRPADLPFPKAQPQPQVVAAVPQPAPTPVASMPPMKPVAVVQSTTLEAQTSYESFAASVQETRKMIDTALNNLLSKAAALTATEVPVARNIAVAPTPQPATAPAVQPQAVSQDYDALLAQAFALSQQRKQDVAPVATSAPASPAPAPQVIAVAPMPAPQPVRQALPLPHELFSSPAAPPTAASSRMESPFELIPQGNAAPNGAPAFETLQLLSAQILEQTERSKRREQSLNDAPPPPFDFLSPKGDSYILNDLNAAHGWQHPQG